MAGSLPPFRADQVGSLLLSPALKAARTRREKGGTSAPDLTAIEDEEIRKLIAKQELIGLSSITDGENCRAWWHYDFLSGLGGVELVEIEQGL